MSRKLPPLNWLRAFEASARSLSFTQAAAELNLTQAAISKQVKLLEHYLSEQLFIRNPRSLELTKTGEAYLPKVRDCFDRLAAGTNEVFGRRRSEMLTIRCMVGFSINWLAPRLPRFMARHPGVTIRIISSVWGRRIRQGAFRLRHSLRRRQVAGPECKATDTGNDHASLRPRAAARRQRNPQTRRPGGSSAPACARL